MKKLYIVALILCSVSAARADRINFPGVYTLTESIASDPNISKDSAVLVITASNVVLECNNHLLTQKATSKSATLDGIIIGPNVSNVTIKNALIRDVNGIGIRVLDGCTNVKILNSFVDSCKGAGISLEGGTTGISSSSIINSTVVNISSTDSPTYGLHIVNGTIISIDSCSFNGQTATNNDCYGILLDTSSYCSITHTRANNNKGKDFTAGIYLLNSANCLLDNCQICNTQTTGTLSSSGAYAICLNGSSKNYCSDNKAIGTQAPNGSAFAIAFCAQEGNNNSFEHSMAQFTQGRSYAAGYNLSGEAESLVTESQAHDTTATSSGTAVGIDLTQSCSNCYVRYNQVTNSSGTSASYGVRDTRSSSTSAVINNVVFNSGNNFSISYPLTITLPVITGSLSSALTGLPAQKADALDNIQISP